VPASDTSFNDDDSEVTAWLYYRNFETGSKSYEFKWYSPEEELAQTNKGTGANALGEGCLWAGILREKLQSYSSGQWRVEFYYDNQLFGGESFTFTSDFSDAEFQITDFVFTSDRYSMANNCDRPTPGTSFSASDSEVTAWVHYRNLGKEKAYQFKWYSPDSKLVQTSEGSSSKDVRRGCTWINVPIKVFEIRTPGEWRVEFVYDGQTYRKETFTFK